MIKKIYPVNDTYVFYWAANTNYNTDTQWLFYSRGLSFEYVYFGAMPQGKIISAYLKAYYYNYTNGTGGDLPIKVITSSWDSATVTWNSGNPTIGSQYGTIPIYGDYGWKTSTNLKSLVEYWQSNPNYGIRIEPNDADYDQIVHCYSKEGTYPPYLEINYVPPGGSFLLYMM